MSPSLVHCRRRKTDHGILKAPSTSANTFWQIEKESDPRSGEPLSWGERCRIRHMPTRRYLAVVEEGNKYKVLDYHMLFVASDASCVWGIR